MHKDALGCSSTLGPRHTAEASASYKACCVEATAWRLVVALLAQGFIIRLISHRVGPCSGFGAFEWYHGSRWGGSQRREKSRLAIIWDVRGSSERHCCISLAKGALQVNNQPHTLWCYRKGAFWVNKMYGLSLCTHSPSTAVASPLMQGRVLDVMDQDSNPEQSARTAAIPTILSRSGYVSSWLRRLLHWMVLVFFHCGVRIGEAAMPGPV